MYHHLFCRAFYRNDEAVHYIVIPKDFYIDPLDLSIQSRA